MEYLEDFQDFLEVWERLPRGNSAPIPYRRDITPANFGELMPSIGLAEFLEKENLTFSYYGSRLETLSSMLLTNKNYYDLLSDQFKLAMGSFHQQLFGMPCGAYVEDLISTASGNKYIFRNLQYPLLNEKGVPSFMIVYASARKPAKDKSLRDQKRLQASSIKTVRFIDLGAGAPSSYVEDFAFHTGK
jgi:hypothetical protein